MNKSNTLTQLDYYSSAESLAQNIEKSRIQLYEILLTYETYETAVDEVNRSIETLRGLKKEHADIKNHRNDLMISTFFPLNLPLYSLILFGVAPSFFAKNVFLRPPEIMNTILNEICDKIDIFKLFPTISLHPSERHMFVELYASASDVILFTGKYENALDISSKCVDSLLLYNGSGVNPFVLFENGDAKIAAEKAVEMRCFNSGQDCAGPDAFVVPESSKEEFLEHLKKQLITISVGDSKDINVRVSKVMKEAYITEVLDFLDIEKTRIVFGGKVVKEDKIVHPTVIVKNVNEHVDNDFHEFFAPIFYVLSYENEEDLKKLLESNAFTNRAMYVSVFGENPIQELIIKKHAKILRNKIVNDVEFGNEEYGGYGVSSNFVKHKEIQKSGPILISRELHSHFSNNL